MIYKQAQLTADLDAEISKLEYPEKDVTPRIVNRCFSRIPLTSNCMSALETRASTLGGLLSSRLRETVEKPPLNPQELAVYMLDTLVEEIHHEYLPRAHGNVSIERELSSLVGLLNSASGQISQLHRSSGVYFCTYCWRTPRNKRNAKVCHVHHSGQIKGPNGDVRRNNREQQAAERLLQRGIRYFENNRSRLGLEPPLSDDPKEWLWVDLRDSFELEYGERFEREQSLFTLYELEDARHYQLRQLNSKGEFFDNQYYWGFGKEWHAVAKLIIEFMQQSPVLSLLKTASPSPSMDLEDWLCSIAFKLGDPTAFDPSYLKPSDVTGMLRRYQYYWYLKKIAPPKHSTKPRKGDSNFSAMHQ